MFGLPTDTFFEKKAKVEYYKFCKKNEISKAFKKVKRKNPVPPIFIHRGEAALRNSEKTKKNQLFLSAIKSTEKPRISKKKGSASLGFDLRPREYESHSL